jgi:hypothetical protein
VWAGEFSVLHCIQTSSGAQPASYTMGTGDSLPEGKVAGASRICDCIVVYPDAFSSHSVVSPEKTLT